MDDIYKRSEFIFSRFDKYLDTVNSKGIVYLTINTFFIGGFVTSIDTLNSKFEITEVTGLFLSVFVGLCFISILLVLLAINPFLSNGTKLGKKASIFYYGSVASYDKQTYQDRLANISSQELADDLSNQIYCLAEGLRAKYHKLQWVGHLIIAEFFLLIPIIILLSINLKS